MPWCEPCAKYLTPTAVDEDGRCPSCGQTVQVHDAHGRITAKNLDLKALSAQGDEDVGTPWHFKLLVGLLCAYFAWRIIDLFR